MDAALLDYAEPQAAKNLDFQIACLDSITAQANRTLTVGLLMISGCFAGVSQFWGDPTRSAMSWGFGGAAVCLVVASTINVTRILSGRAVQPPGVEPSILLEYAEDHTNEQVRRASFEQIQERITLNREQGAKAGGSLKTVHQIMVYSPLAFLAAAAVGVAVR